MKKAFDGDISAQWLAVANGNVRITNRLKNGEELTGAQMKFTWLHEFFY